MNGTPDPQERAAVFTAAALEYSTVGWTLIDLKGKVPRRRRWQQTRYAAPDEAAGLWSHWGKSADMGVHLGASHVCVVEPDTPEALATLLELLDGELPPVPIAKSGGRSIHLYFADTGLKAASRDGLELRAGNQQCVLPPSVHPLTGLPSVWLPGHELRAAPAVAVPESVVAYLGAKGTARRAGPVAGVIPEGGRHPDLLSLAGSMRARGMDAEEILAALRAVNERRGNPPLDDREVEKLARDVARRYEPRVDSGQERARARARELLAEHDSSAATKATKARTGVPFGRFGRFGRTETWAMPMLGAQAMHGPAGAWAEASSDYIEGARVGVLISALVAFGNAVNRGPYMQVGVTKHAANEFVLLIGPTATARKGDTVRMGTFPVERADPEWFARVQNGFGSGEGVIWEVRDPVVAEADTDGDQSDESDQSLRLLDPGSDDKRLLIRQSEFASILKVAARAGSTLSALLREAWDGDTLANRTKGRKVVATNAHVSILAGCTPEELRRLVTVTDVASGFLNRFVITAVTRERLRDDPELLPERVASEHAHVFRDALMYARSNAGRIERDAAAAATWKHAYTTELAIDRPGLAGAALGRAEAHTLRLSLLYALLDKSTQIRDEHVRAALALWRYCEASTRMLFGDQVGNPTADVIVAELGRRASKPATRTELRDLFSRHRTVAEIDQALAELLALGLIQIETQDTRGRPVELISLNRQETPS